MALPKRHDIDGAYPDTRVRRAFRWLSAGDPVDLTDWAGQLRIGQNGAELLEVDDGVVLGGVDGSVTMDIPPGTLTDPGNYSYVVDLVDPNDELVRFVNGALRVQAVFP